MRIQGKFCEGRGGETQKKDMQRYRRNALMIFGEEFETQRDFFILLKEQMKEDKRRERERERALNIISRYETYS